MCTGGGGGGGDGGAAAAEAARQQKITDGYNQIQKIFGGYSTGTGDVTDYQAGGNYYTADGTPVTYGSQQRAIAAPNTDHPTKGYVTPPTQYQTVNGYTGADGKFVDMGDNKLFSGVSQVKGFDDDFYNSRATAYDNYALPQVDEQYAEAQKQLEYALARNGRLDSSTAVEQRAKLLDKYNQQKTATTDKGLQYANQARSSVEGSRSDLVALNSNLANPTQVAAEAQSRLAGLQAMPAFDPLGPLFTNAGESLGTQADLERRSSARYNTGLFTPAAVSTGSGSGRIIN